MMMIDQAISGPEHRTSLKDQQARQTWRLDMTA